MRERLDQLAQELEAVEARLADPAVLADQQQLRQLSRRHKELEPVVAVARARNERESDLEVARELLAESVGDERDLARREVDEAEADIGRLDEELKLLLLPRDPNDGKAVIVEIRAREGGEEANLFARDLFGMYQAYAVRRGWPVEVLSSSPSDMGGFDEVTFLVKGPDAWSHLKHEGGPHRVQRVPVTESQGRVHTSSATVTVLPEAEEVDVDIDPNDLQVDVYRSSGPGGQSVNTTDSAVRLTHKPTGLVVAMQDEKSQIQNRAKALRVLRSRLLKLEQDRQSAELSEQRRGQVGGGGRSEKIRTYSYKENRVTDHRIGLTLYKLDKVLAGELDDVVDALLADERTRQLKRGRHRLIAVPGTGADEVTWRSLLAEAGTRFGAAGLPSPAVDARRVVEQASGWEGAEVALHLDEHPTVRSLAAFERMVDRRAAGTPLQYVLGRWGFRSLDLFVDDRVLIPRPETEQVVEVALAEARRLGPPTQLRAVDLGTGSGAIACSLAAELVGAAVWGVDRSSAALAVARANLAGLGRAATRVTLLEGSWFEPLPVELRGEIDLVVANPPYVAADEALPAEVADWEPHEALVAGPTGLEDLDAIVAAAPHWLRRPGALVVELAPHQADAVAARARAVGFDEVEVRPDLAGRQRALVARRHAP